MPTIAGVLQSRTALFLGRYRLALWGNVVTRRRRCRLYRPVACACLLNSSPSPIINPASGQVASSTSRPA